MRRGVELGRAGYITKPFSPKEVVARVKAVLRRFEQPLQKEIVKAGELVIDTAAMRVTTRGEEVVTMATEFRLIEFLATHPGRVFTRKALLDAVWHDTAFVTPRIVDVYIRRLREKIERDPEHPRHIHTVRGAGYMLSVRKSHLASRACHFAREGSATRVWLRANGPVPNAEPQADPLVIQRVFRK